MGTLPAVLPQALPTPAVAERHLLNRFSFGCTPELAAEAAAAGGPYAWFEAQLDPTSVPDPFADALPSWWPHLSMAAGQLQARDDAGTLSSLDVSSDLLRWTLMRRAYSRRQLHEVMAAFWLDHLHVTVHDGGSWAVRAEHDTAVRGHALGRFDDMLRQVVLGRAMGCYLDNSKSTARRLNENLGRELLELHTVGRDSGYSERDVLDAARVLTSHRVDRAGTWDAWYAPSDHWVGPVRVLGFEHANSASDGRPVAEELLHYLAHHPATARRLALKLCRRFVSDTPSDDVIGAVAQAYLDSGTDIAATLRVLVARPEFEAAVDAKTRTPVEDCIATWRALGMRPIAPTRDSDFAHSCVIQAGTAGRLRLPDYRISRRGLLRGAAAAVTTSLVGDVFTQTAYGNVVGGNVLVVVSLRGGADGLSLVVPHGDPGYAQARPTIGIPTGSLVAKDAMFGLHPAFAPLLPMWTAGSFAAVHAVGMPQPNRSHFAAMEEVEDADPGSPERRGWINRMVGLMGAPDPVRGMQLGSGVVPTSLYGEQPTVALRNYRKLTLPAATGSWAQPTRQSLATAWSGVDTPLGRGALSTLDVTQRLASLNGAAAPANGARYPATSLGDALAETARTVRADVGARVIAVDCGAWDHHTGLGTIQAGLLRNNAVDLAGSLAAFFTDLGTAGTRVTVLTISEFGRRVRENGGNGTDHGYGNCMLALGAGVRGGRYVAQWPGLSAGNLVEGDLRVTTDYRSVLSEAVGARFPEVSVPQVFPGYSASAVGLF